MRLLRRGSSSMFFIIVMWMTLLTDVVSFVYLVLLIRMTTCTVTLVHDLPLWMNCLRMFLRGNILIRSYISFYPLDKWRTLLQQVVTCIYWGSSSSWLTRDFNQHLCYA